MVYKLTRRDSDASFDKSDHLTALSSSWSSLSTFGDESAAASASALLPRTKQDVERSEKAKGARRRRRGPSSASSGDEAEAEAEAEAVDRIIRKEERRAGGVGQLPLYRMREDGSFSKRRRRRSSSCGGDASLDSIDSAAPALLLHGGESASATSSDSASSFLASRTATRTSADTFADQRQQADPNTLPLTTSDLPAPPASAQSKLLSALYYTTFATLLVLFLRNQSRASTLHRTLHAARHHSLSSRHQLDVTTHELRSYDTSLSSLEVHATQLRSELDGLQTDLSTRERRLSVSDRLVLGQHDDFVRKMKRTERARNEQLASLRTRVQESSRASVLDQYGPKGSYRVRVTLDLDNEEGKHDETTSSFVIETASLSQSPHTVHHFLDQINAKLWNDGGLKFTSNPGHMIKAIPSSTQSELAFAGAGLDKIMIDESPSSFATSYGTSSMSMSMPTGAPSSSSSSSDVTTASFLDHAALTVAYPTHSLSNSNGGIGFYINTADNTDVHGQDPIIGRIVEGEEALKRLLAIPANGSRGGLLMGGGVKIVKAEIL